MKGKQLQEETKRKSRRGAIVGWGLGAAAVIAGAAAAATLTLTATGISGGSDTAEGCDTALDMSIGSPTYDAASSAYVVSQVSYAGLDTGSCDGLTLYVTVADGSGASQADGSMLITNGSTGSSGTVSLNQSVAVGDAELFAVAIS